MSRPETGPMKFGDDWRGVFIRGDNAFHFATTLDYAIALLRDGDINRYVLQGLRDTLASADERVTDVETQYMRPFDEAIKPGAE